MKFVTTNIRLPESLWQELKREALEKRKRLSQIIRERLGYTDKSISPAPALRGLWKNASVSENIFLQAKTSWKKKYDKLS